MVAVFWDDEQHFQVSNDTLCYTPERKSARVIKARAVWKLHLSTFLFVRRQLIGDATLGEEGDEQCEG